MITSNAPADTGDVEALRERIEDWLHDGRWPEPYDLSHAILASDWLSARDAAQRAEGYAQGHAAAVAYFEEVSNSVRARIARAVTAAGGDGR